MQVRDGFSEEATIEFFHYVWNDDRKIEESLVKGTVLADIKQILQKKPDLRVKNGEIPGYVEDENGDEESILMVNALNRLKMPELVEYIFAYDPTLDIDSRNCVGNTMLYEFAAQGNYEMCDVLIRHGADRNADCGNYTPRLAGSAFSNIRALMNSGLDELEANMT